MKKSKPKVRVEVFTRIDIIMNPKGKGSCCIGSMLRAEETPESLQLRNNIYNATRDMDVTVEYVNFKKPRWPEGTRRDILRLETFLKKEIFGIKEFPTLVIRNNVNCLNYLSNRNLSIVIHQGNEIPLVDEIKSDINSL